MMKKNVAVVLIILLFWVLWDQYNVTELEVIQQRWNITIQEKEIVKKDLSDRGFVSDPTVDVYILKYNPQLEDTLLNQ